MKPNLKHGLLKERFSAIVTDALRAEYLEREGYEVQVLEFIDMEHTPKNILIRAIDTGIKGKNPDARHHCYAWRLGAAKNQFRTNDDGEPSSTAGKPIFGQIQSFDLTNVLIVVVRYFGGTKLGVSGLINAYREAAADAIRNAVIVEKTVDEILRIRFSYLVLNDVMKVIKEDNPEVLERNFELSCEMLLAIRRKELPKLIERLEKIDSLSIIEE